VSEKEREREREREYNRCHSNRIIGNYSEKLYASKQSNLDMGKCLETYNLPRLTHEDIESEQT
jgi:hypothetical protein